MLPTLMLCRLGILPLSPAPIDACAASCSRVDDNMGGKPRDGGLMPCMASSTSPPFGGCTACSILSASVFPSV
jgi:hypothetical protein